MKVPLTLFTISSFIFLNLDNSFGQVFEGKIVYKTTIENAHPERISNEIFNQMFHGETDSISIFYIENDKYKFVEINSKTKKAKIICQYDPEKKRIYQSIGSNDSDLSHVDLKDLSLEKPKVSINNSDTIYILGKKCKSLIIINSKTQLKTIIYYSDDYRVDTKSLENNSYFFSEYIYLSGALPLKMVITGDDAIFKVVYTAKEIIKEKLGDKVFMISK